MEELKGKEVKGYMKLLRVDLYKDIKVYIRQIGRTYFEYVFEYHGEIYSSYIIIKPQGKKRTLTENQIMECRDLIFAGATATIDSLLGVEMDEKSKEYAELFEKNRDKVDVKK